MSDATESVYVETDFLVALINDDDWLQGRAETVLAERSVVTDPLAYLEVLLINERRAFDYERLVANLLELVPVGSADRRQIVLKAVSYYEDGLTPFDAFHAATAEQRGLSILSSDGACDGVDPDRVLLEPDEDD